MLRERPTRSLEHDRPGAALDRSSHPAVAAEAALLRADLERLVAAIAPWLLELLGGPTQSPASSGQVTRHRLNRGGDRQLNRALHTIVPARLRDDPSSRA